MRKALLITAALAVALPAAASAKTGVVFDSDQTLARIGEKVDFTVIAIRDPRDPGNPGEPRPVVGRRPLVTFRSGSGRVVRVRASETDLNGIGYGTVAFPDKGPWTTAMRVGDLALAAEESSPFPVAQSVPHSIPSPVIASDHPARSPDSGGVPWVWILSVASIGSALLVLAVRRRRHWGAAP